MVKPHFYIRLGQEARLDLAAWSMFLENYNGTSLLIIQWQSSEKLELFTDASGLGFAGTLIGHWFQGYYPPSWLEFSTQLSWL